MAFNKVLLLAGIWGMSMSSPIDVKKEDTKTNPKQILEETKMKSKLRKSLTSALFLTATTFPLNMFASWISITPHPIDIHIITPDEYEDVFEPESDKSLREMRRNNNEED